VTAAAAGGGRRLAGCDGAAGTAGARPGVRPGSGGGVGDCNVKQAVKDTTDLAPSPTAGCCHLANLMACS